MPGVRPADVQTGARSRCICAAIRSWSAAMRFLRCSGVALWRGSGVAPWRCSGVAPWRGSGAALGRGSGVAVWRCSGVAQLRTANTTNAKVADFHIPMTMPFRLRLSCGATASRSAAASDGDGRRYRGLNRPPSPPDLPQQLLCPRSGKFRRFRERARTKARPIDDAGAF